MISGYLLFNRMTSGIYREPFKSSMKPCFAVFIFVLKSSVSSLLLPMTECLLMYQAVRIMELALQKYGSYEKFEQATGGNLLTKSRIWYHVKKYMEKEGCIGEVRE